LDQRSTPGTSYRVFRYSEVLTHLFLLSMMDIDPKQDLFVLLLI
jgi:hypothetical protein